MIWGKVMLGAAIIWAFLFFGFYSQLGKGESFYFGHYFWLIMVAVFVFWAGKKYFYPPRLVTRPRLGRQGQTRRLIRNQMFLGLGVVFLISSLALFLSLKTFSEPIGGQDLIVMGLFVLIGLGFVSRGLDLFAPFRQYDIRDE